MKTVYYQAIVHIQNSRSAQWKRRGPLFSPDAVCPPVFSVISIPGTAHAQGLTGIITGGAVSYPDPTQLPFTE